MSVALENLRRTREIAARQCPEVADRIYGRRQEALSPKPQAEIKPRAPRGPADMNDPDVLVCAAQMWREGQTGRAIQDRFKWSAWQFEMLRGVRRELFPYRTSERWTSDRIALLQRQYPAGVRVATMVHDINVLPGAPVNADQLRSYATGTLGLQRPAHR